MESKLTCPNCNGSGCVQVPYPIERGFAVTLIVCPMCGESGDLLQGEMSELRARAILKAARDKCGGFVHDGRERVTFVVPEHNGIKWIYGFSMCSTEYAFLWKRQFDEFISLPRVEESLDFIFRPKQS